VNGSQVISIHHSGSSQKRELTRDLPNKVLERPTRLDAAMKLRILMWVVHIRLIYMKKATIQSILVGVQLVLSA
jgi:hypothetical protein